MEVQAYLDRINYHGSLAATAETLRALHVAHLLSVPFENLSIHAGERIVLEEASLFSKVVERKRGGFCYELNGLFAALLRTLGFDVAMLSAQVSKKDGGYGSEFDHMTLMVSLERPWLADVGFGDSFLEPLLLDDEREQPRGSRAYRMVPDGDSLIMMQRDGGAEWKPQYRFTLRAYELRDFAGMCEFHQTSPESSFTRARICSMATETGRITLSETKFITTRKGEREERTLESDADFDTILRDRFGIVVGRRKAGMPLDAGV